MNQVFKIGEKVIALNSSKGTNAQDRIKGKIYTVTNIMYCPNNGSQIINIENSPAKASSGKIKCTCGQNHGNWNLGWTLSDRFVRPEDIPAMLEIAVAEEDYDTAILLRDINKDVVEND